MHIAWLGVCYGPHLQILKVVVINEHHIWGGFALPHETRDRRSE